MPRDLSVQLATGGKWTRAKRLDILLDAVKGLDVQLKIFGSIEDDEARERIEKEENVSFLGWQDREGTLRTLGKCRPCIMARTTYDPYGGCHSNETIQCFYGYYGSTSHHIRGNGAYFFPATPWRSGSFYKS